MLFRSLRNKHKLEGGEDDDFGLVNTGEVAGEVDSLTGGIAAVVMPITFISLVVGGIVVMNIQLASFNERVREVGTRKAIGATPAQIFAQFLAESVLVSLFGGFIGLFVGQLFCSGIGLLLRAAPTMSPDTAVKALVFAAGTGLIFGMYPAVRASRLNPIEALRTE